jgi:L-fuconolactonase
LIYPKHLAVATEFVRRFPEQRFVLDHLAKPEIKSGTISAWNKGMAELAAYPNVYCKLSGLVTEADWNRWKPEDMRPYLDVAFERFGANRLLIGSDWPVCTMGLVKDYLSGHPEQEREAILGGNARRFWRLNA